MRGQSLLSDKARAITWKKSVQIGNPIINTGSRLISSVVKLTVIFIAVKSQVVIY